MGILILSLSVIIYIYIKNPIKPFVFKVNLDISGRRKVSYYNVLDEYLNNNTDFEKQIDNAIFQWNINCENIINRSIFKKRRNYQYQEICKKHPKVVEFVYLRNQTRYRQKNYKKESYVVQQIDNIQKFTISSIKNRLEKLEKINYSTSLEKYYSNEQRKLMTPKLKNQVKVRDNYTCQICGKYMPDNVGLHIDHIIPIKKGGKSVYENLQVLCSVCNGNKGSK